MKVDIESKNRLAAFLKFRVDTQYKPSYTFKRFFLSQSPPSSNKLESLYKQLKFNDSCGPTYKRTEAQNVVGSFMALLTSLLYQCFWKLDQNPCRKIQAVVYGTPSPSFARLQLFCFLSPWVAPMLSPGFMVGQEELDGKFHCKQTMVTILSIAIRYETYVPCHQFE